MLAAAHPGQPALPLAPQTLRDGQRRGGGRGQIDRPGNLPVEAIGRKLQVAGAGFAPHLLQHPHQLLGGGAAGIEHRARHRDLPEEAQLGLIRPDAVVQQGVLLALPQARGAGDHQQG